MAPFKPNGLSKEERICSRLLIERLFKGGESKSLSSFPLRVVYLITDIHEHEPAVKMMVSVSKRHFKQAVKRNKVKRQIRESYRLNKHLLVDAMSKLDGKQLDVSFIWLSDDIYLSQEVNLHMRNLLERIKEKL